MIGPSNNESPSGLTSRPSKVGRLPLEMMALDKMLFMGLIERRFWSRRLLCFLTLLVIPHMIFNVAHIVLFTDVHPFLGLEDMKVQY